MLSVGHASPSHGCYVIESNNLNKVCVTCAYQANELIEHLVFQVSPPPYIMEYC